ncbi:DUF2849 domain-containing protein [Afifella pfennigii]|uniref:DUF2849 domain-containing protein n=1 Tax=Afifella pfennigii TaxID=209897 RepID=UPI00047A4B47|nr:DUF2849 domain-containing protein [Afifella pfennigii]
MSAKFTHPKVLTANRLADGAVVWLGETGAWVEAIEAARHFGAHDIDAAHVSAAEAVAAGLVVDPDAIEVVVGPQGIVPVRLREKIRALGPTIRPDLGKKACGLKHAA